MVVQIMQQDGNVMYVQMDKNELVLPYRPNTLSIIKNKSMFNIYSY